MIGIGASMLSPAVAWSDLPCGTRDTILATLSAQYGERPIARGLAANGAMIEVVAADTGSFTLLLTQPNGISCLLATGELWRLVVPLSPEAKEGGAGDKP